MGSLQNSTPHVVCIPFPAQGHINPMLKLAKLLHHRSFHVTFVNTEYNHRRLLRSRGAQPDDPTFRFMTIPDGLDQADKDATQDVPSLCDSTAKTCSVPFKNLILEINSTRDRPPVSCVVCDGVMSFGLVVAQELGIPSVLFWTTSACGFMGYVQYPRLVQKGLVPLKDESYLTNGFLDTVVDWIPGINDMCFKDIPSFMRTTNPNGIMVNFVLNEIERAKEASAIILNTFDSLENDFIDAIQTSYPPILPIGPLQNLLNQIPKTYLKNIGSNLWKEEHECLTWLDSKEPNSVVYVNFGSVTVMTRKQLSEFAWGLANSGQMFLWIIRPDLVIGDSGILDEFLVETKERGILASWCPQEQVLSHKSVGVFLTHCGWNSTLESISSGVPVICWPFFAEQQTNCWACCNKWGIGMEIDSDVKRNEVEDLVREMTVGKRGKETKRKAMEWMKLGEEATERLVGSSYKNFEKVISILLSVD